METVTYFAPHRFCYWHRYCTEPFVFVTSVKSVWFEQNISLHYTGLEVITDCTQHLSMRTVSGQEDIPVCRNESNALMHSVCKIRTVGTLGEECRVGFRDGQLSEQQCEPSFTLITKNQTLFLHLTSLTPLDSGNYTCVCVHAEEMNCILLLNLTVEGKQFFFS